MACTATGEIYIGSSVDIGRRCRQHKNAMRHRKGKSSKMQQRWDMYPEQFGYTVLCACPPDELLQREQDLIDRFQPELNTAPYAYSSSCTKRTEEQKERLKLRPQSSAKKHLFRGELLTAQQIAARVGVTVGCIRARMREGKDVGLPSQAGAPKPIDVKGEGLTPKEIAAKFELPLTTVYSRIRYGWSGDRITKPKLHRGRNSP